MLCVAGWCAIPTYISQKSTTPSTPSPLFPPSAHFSQGYAFLKDIKAEDERNLKKFIKVSKEEEKVEEAKNKLKAIKRASREETKGKWRRQRTS